MLPQALKVEEEEGEPKGQDLLEVVEVCCHSSLQEREAWQRKECQEEEEEGQMFQEDLDPKKVVLVAGPGAAAAVA